MLKAIFGSAALIACSLTIGASAEAQTLGCNYGDISRLQDSIGQMTEASKKDEAMGQVAAARAAMNRTDNADCMNHMNRIEQLNH
jgi:hypothetical protein